MPKFYGDSKAVPCIYSCIYQVRTAQHFIDFLNSHSDYRNSFTDDGAAALMEGLQNVAIETDTAIKFDPIGFCCDYVEVSSLEQLQRDYNIGSIAELTEKTLVLSTYPIIVFKKF